MLLGIDLHGIKSIAHILNADFVDFAVTQNC
jgi:hypothetical protein